MAGTRQRIIEVSAALMSRNGYEATGIKAIVSAASAPFGSIYHFFPGGKEELGAATIRWSGAEYGKLLPLVLSTAPDLVTGVRAFFDGAAEHLVATDFADACPIATVALEVSSRSEVLRVACAEVFDDWISLGVEQFVSAGLPEAEARPLIIELLAGLEGAFVLCRATRRREALDVVGRAAASSVAAALAPSHCIGP